jgi:hypothetical protein
MEPNERHDVGQGLGVVTVYPQSRSRPQEAPGALKPDASVR